MQGRKLCWALTIVIVLPVGAELLSVDFHGKTRVCYTERIFSVDLTLMRGLSVVRWASSRHKSRWQGKGIFPQGKFFDYQFQSQDCAYGCFLDH